MKRTPTPAKLEELAKRVDAAAHISGVEGLLIVREIEGGQALISAGSEVLAEQASADEAGQLIEAHRGQSFAVVLDPGERACLGEPSQQDLFRLRCGGCMKMSENGA